MSQGYSAYKLYLGIKLHFDSDSYNFFKYNGNVRATEISFEKRKDKYFFERLSRKYSQKDLIDYFVSNFVAESSLSQMLRSPGAKVFDAWKTQLTLPKFETEVSVLLSGVTTIKDFDNLFKSPGHPPVFKALMGKKISLETVTILDKLFNFTPDLETDFIIEGYVRRVRKYKDFITFDERKYSRKLKEMVNDRLLRIGTS